MYIYNILERLIATDLMFCTSYDIRMTSQIKYLRFVFTLYFPIYTIRDFPIYTILKSSEVRAKNLH